MLLRASALHQVGFDTYVYRHRSTQTCFSSLTYRDKTALCQGGFLPRTYAEFVFYRLFPFGPKAISEHRMHVRRMSETL